PADGTLFILWHIKSEMEHRLHQFPSDVEVDDEWHLLPEATLNGAGRARSTGRHKIGCRGFNGVTGPEIQMGIQRIAGPGDSTAIDNLKSTVYEAIEIHVVIASAHLVDPRQGHPPI